MHLFLWLFGCPKIQPSTEFLEKPFQGRDPDFVIAATEDFCRGQLADLTPYAPFVSRYVDRLSTGYLLIEISRGPLTTTAACRVTELRCEVLECIDFAKCCVLGTAP